MSWSSCEENGIEYVIDGEQGKFPCFGYTIDVPNDSTPKQFQDMVEKHQDLLFGRSARGLNIEANFYDPSSDYWMYVQELWEYGISGEQVLSTPTSNF